MGNCIRPTFSNVQGHEVGKKNKFGYLSKICRRRKLCSSGREEMELLIRKCSSIPERVKIVVSKKQLERLIGRVEEVQLRRMMLESWLRRAKKWSPSLAAIPELS